ncbi:MAG: hypothetical protein A2309_02930 [Bacteroidetes bacterium RIFOXYB2_FULL_35_7]|nr:MAG: hypothetical protein A2309_02930 [Bacteroidetes bacterium RIFOXYB2_FULL_35_7]OGH90939.1 MAG: hypothetical protein A2479_04790 [Candidatus Magasanikbacteria bacterium RIFOXYC2_FULL_39_8]
MPQYLSVNTFGGLNRNEQLIIPIQQNSLSDQLQNCLNFQGGVSTETVAPSPLLSFQNLTPLLGTITKSKAVINFPYLLPATPDPVVPTSGRARGMFQFFPSPGKLTNSELYYAQCSSDYNTGTLFKLKIDSTIWVTLGSWTRYHTFFCNYNDKVFLCANRIQLSKTMSLWDDWISRAYDKSAAASFIVGEDLTFTNGDTAVTGTGGTFSSSWRGLWIKKTAADDWYEVVSVLNANTLYLSTVYSGVTGNGGLGNSQKANAIGEIINGLSYGCMPKFIISFKEKLFIANFEVTTSVIAPTRLRWSVTGDTEDWGGLGSGYIEVGEGDGQAISGLGKIEDLLFVFKDRSSYIYRWTGDVDTPITLIKTFNFGCISNRTIQEVTIGGVAGLIYLSNKDVRFTNGYSDYSIAGNMHEFFLKSLETRTSSTFFGATETDNYYPWAIIDKQNTTYSLCFPNSTTNYTVVYIYNYASNKWIGTSQYYDAGVGTSVTASSYYNERIVFAGTASTNQLKQFDSTVNNISMSGILESATFYSGLPNKNMKIHWIEFAFKPNTSLPDIIIYLYCRKNFQTLSTNQTYTLNATTLGTNGYPVNIKRFYINDTFKYFSWYLLEDAADSSSSNFGIISWTICYDIVDTV